MDRVTTGRKVTKDPTYWVASDTARNRVLVNERQAFTKWLAACAASPPRSSISCCRRCRVALVSNSRRERMLASPAPVNGRTKQG